MHFIQVILVFLILLHLPSCTHKELCTDHSHVMEVDVRFDWSAVPDAAPETMSLYLFPLDGGKSQRYEFTDFRGGRIRVKAGEYQAICLNSDTRNIKIPDSESFDSFLVTTKDAEMMTGMTSLGVRSDEIPKIKGTEDERVAMSPDSIWTGRLGNLVLDAPAHAIEMTMEKGFDTFNIEIKNAENLRYARAVSGSLTTLVEALHPATGELSEGEVTVPFEMMIDQEEEIVKGSLLTFGHCPREKKRHHMTIYAVMADGSKVYYTYDVTDQIHSSPDDSYVVIVLDGLQLPEPDLGGSGGGFKPDVNGWNHIDVEIDM